MLRRIPSMLFACSFGIGVSAYACDQKANLPTDLLGRELNQIRQKFISITYDGDFYDEFDNDKTDERWLVIDEDRRYVTLHTVDGVVSEMLVSDKLYSTQENIRVGDLFSKVYSAYPDISFRAGKKGVATGIYDLVTKDRKITFWFDTSEIRKRINEGEKITFGDEIVQKMKVTLIHIVE